MLDKFSEASELNPDIDFKDDPASQFGIEEAVKPYYIC
jgi:hypothetical protein